MHFFIIKVLKSDLDLYIDYSPKYKQPADENFILTVFVFSGY